MFLREQFGKQLPISVMEIQYNLGHMYSGINSLEF